MAFQTHFSRLASFSEKLNNLHSFAMNAFKLFLFIFSLIVPKENIKDWLLTQFSGTQISTQMVSQSTQYDWPLAFVILLVWILYLFLDKKISNFSKKQFGTLIYEYEVKDGKIQIRPKFMFPCFLLQIQGYAANKNMYNLNITLEDLYQERICKQLEFYKKFEIYYVNEKHWVYHFSSPRGKHAPTFQLIISEPIVCYEFDIPYTEFYYKDRVR